MFPDLSMLPLLICVILGKLPELSVLPYLSCVTLGKLPILSVSAFQNPVIILSLLEHSVLPLKS